MELSNDISTKILKLSQIKYISTKIQESTGSIYNVRNELNDFGRFGFTSLIQDISIALWPNCSSYVRLCPCPDCNRVNSPKNKKLKVLTKIWIYLVLLKQ